MWGLLPVSMKLLLDEMDPYTVTWYRFSASALVLGAYLAIKHRLPTLRPLRQGYGLLMLIAVAGICGNYLLYVLGLGRTTPSIAQVVIQLAPLLVIVGGVVLFHERLSRLQVTGLMVAIAGLAVFFNDRLPELFSASGTDGMGVLIIILAAVVWAAYALAQKQMLKVYPSENIMLMLYVTATFLFLPWAHLGQARDMDALGWYMLAFCSANTLIAYGCFAEALNHWQASRVSAVLAMAPLVTLASMKLLGTWLPAIAPVDRVDALAVLGALMVVTGSTICATGGMRR
jgi:drug/metabolite transporter (DMT)-like permease